MAQTMINFRMDASLNIKMDAVCREMGMSPSTAYTIFANADSSRIEVAERTETNKFILHSASSVAEFFFVRTYGLPFTFFPHKPTDFSAGLYETGGLFMAAGCCFRVLLFTELSLILR